MPKNATGPVLAAGAVLWRPGVTRPRRSRSSTARATTTGRCPKARSIPGETEPVTAVREIEEETGYRRVLGRRLMSVSYPVEQGTKKVRYWAARVPLGRRVQHPNDEVDKLVWLPVGGRDEPAGLSARPEGVAPVHQTARRHPDGADRPARHGGPQEPLQGRRPQAAAGQARPGPGGIAGRPAAGVRRDRSACRRPDALPPDDRAVGRRAGRDDP